MKKKDVRTALSVLMTIALLVQIAFWIFGVDNYTPLHIAICLWTSKTFVSLVKVKKKAKPHLNTTSNADEENEEKIQFLAFIEGVKARSKRFHVISSEEGCTDSDSVNEAFSVLLNYGYEPKGRHKLGDVTTLTFERDDNWTPAQD